MVVWFIDYLCFYLRTEDDFDLAVQNDSTVSLMVIHSRSLIMLYVVYIVMYIVYIFRGSFGSEMLLFSRVYCWPNMHFPSGLGRRASTGKAVLITVLGRNWQGSG